jgi:hypothetical protein
MQQIPWVETCQTATEFQKRSQYFIGTHNEPLSVAVRFHNETKALRKKFHVFVKCWSSDSLDNSMETNPIAQDSGWNFSFCFAISSPLIGVLLAMLALAIFCR